MKINKIKFDWVVILVGLFLVSLFIYGAIVSETEIKLLNGECRYCIAKHTSTFWNRGFINNAN